MRGVLVHDIDGLPDQVFDLARQILLNGLEGLDRRRIGIGNLEIPIGKNHIDRRVFHHVLNASRFEFRLLCGGDIRGKFDHFEWLAVGVKNRIIGGLNPHFLAAFAYAQILARIKFSTVESGPEVLILWTGRIGGVHEHPMMLPLNFVQGIPQGCQEIFIRIQNGAIQVEINDRVPIVDRIIPGFEFGRLLFKRGDIRGIFDDFIGDAIRIEDRIVGGFNPDFLAAFAHALILA